MADVVKASLAELSDPAKYICKAGVPWFRPHKRQIYNEHTKQYEELEVTENDLPEIVQNMQALEQEGRAFRLSNGHIKKDADEKDQPELLAFARNARIGTFGPKKVPCVLVDEYCRADKADTMNERPYRSAEYYRGKKLITGAAALIRDPHLNLGIVLYKGNEPVIFYAEPVEAMPELSTNEDDPTPEEIKLFKRFQMWQEQQQQQAAAQQNAAMGPMNAGMPGQQPAGYQEQDMSQVSKPEDAVQYAELEKRVKASESESAALRKELEAERLERKKDRVNGTLDKLEKVEHYSLDRSLEFDAMMAADDAGVAKIEQRIRKYHERAVGYEDRVPVLNSDDSKPLPDRAEKTVHDEPEHYQETIDFMRESGETDYFKAEREVKARHKK